MKNGLLYLLPFLSSFSYAQVGIGTATPKAFFNVSEGRTVLFGNDTTGSVSSSQIFTPKLIWYSTKSAFRVGAISGSVDNYSAWDYANTGYYSFASGLNTQARGYAATSLGSRTTASGNYATSMGNNATASGEFSTAMGFSTTASNYYATALGYQTTASGEAAIAIGRGTTASGIAAIAMGNSSFASGENATAIGSSAFANGRNSMALGSFVSTSTKSGSFILGDNTDANSITNTYVNSANNQMMMRFSGGYMLYSSAPNTQASAVGVQLASGDNAWQTLSDSTRKENFRAVNGVDFLKKLPRCVWAVGTTKVRTLGYTATTDPWPRTSLLLLVMTHWASSAKTKASTRPTSTG